MFILAIIVNKVPLRITIICFSSWADNGRGLILRVITKLCIKICLSHIPIHYFNAFDVQKCKQNRGLA